MPNDLFDSLLAQARKTNAVRDRIDREKGNGAPADYDVATQLRTVLSALQAGINTQDWNCVAEGYVMLEHAEAAIRPVYRLQRGPKVDG